MNSEEDIGELLTQEIAARARLEPEQIRPAAHFLLDFGMSSIDVLRVLAFAEKTFSIRFPDEQLAELTTLNKVVEAIRVHQREQSVEEQ